MNILWSLSTTKFSWFIFLFIFISNSHLILCTSYYINASTTNTLNCTSPSNACKDFVNIYSNLINGDSIYFMPGAYVIGFPLYISYSLTFLAYDMSNLPILQLSTVMEISTFNFYGFIFQFNINMNLATNSMNLSFTNCKFISSDINNSSLINGFISSFIFSNCTFNNLTSSKNGLISFASSNVTMSNCNFTNINYMGNDTGAIANDASYINISKCQFFNVKSMYIGAISVAFSNITVSQTSFIKCSSTLAVVAGSNSNGTFSGCIFDNNVPAINRYFGSYTESNTASFSYKDSSSLKTFSSNESRTFSSVEPLESKATIVIVVGSVVAAAVTTIGGGSIAFGYCYGWHKIGKLCKNFFCSPKESSAKMTSISKKKKEKQLDDLNLKNIA